MANSDLVKSLVKGLDILQAVGESPTGLVLAEVSEQLELKKPAAYNLLRTLCSRGFLEKNGGGRYKLGVAMRKLAEKDGEISFQQHVAEALKTLIIEYPTAIVNYAEIIGTDLCPRQRIVPERPNIVQTPVGMTYHHYYSPSGFLNFAFNDPALLRRIEQDYPFEEYNSFRSRAEFDTKVEEAKKLGYSWLAQDRRGVRVAAPVFIHKSFRGCIGVFFPEETSCDEPVEQIANTLLKYAKLLST